MDDPKDDPKTALLSTQYGMGANADGEIESFPASELNARVAARDAEEAGMDAAIEQDEEDPTDISDLDELHVSEGDAVEE